MLQSANLYLSATSGRMEKKEKGERQKSFSHSVPRAGTRHRNHGKIKEFIFLIINNLQISYILHFCHILPIFCYSVHF